MNSKDLIFSSLFFHDDGLMQRRRVWRKGLRWRGFLKEDRETHIRKKEGESFAI